MSYAVDQENHRSIALKPLKPSLNKERGIFQGTGVFLQPLAPVDSEVLEKIKDEPTVLKLLCQFKT